MSSGHGLAAPVRAPQAQTGTRIKDITFESGTLTDPTTGVDSTSGTVNLETSTPLKGSYSATIPNVTSGYLNENISAAGELFLSVYVRAASFPSSARLIQISNSGTTVGSIYLTSSGTLQLRSGSTTLGTSAALSAGTLYRIGLHQKAGTGSNGVLEAYVATGDAAFGSAFASSSTETFTTQATQVRIGATNSSAVNATVDDLRLDTAVMPGPSGSSPTPTPGGPTATPTNTAVPPTPTGTPVPPTATPPPSGAPAAYDITMTYDTLGRITSKTGVGAYGYPASGASSVRPHAVSSAGVLAYTYDNNGNMLSGGGRSYTWTAENLPATITANGSTESYTYDADGERVVRTAGGVTTVYFEGLWEQTTTGARKLYYTFNGAVAAVRDSSSGLSYLHADHLGSISIATSSTGTLASRQDYDPWGAVRSGSLPQTTLGFTGQRRDGTGLLYYHARMYDPVLARFVSADSVVPGAASGSLDGIALKPLTVDFHDVGFGATLNGENGQRFWFQLSDRQRQQAGDPWGPTNPQALNRYSYVRNGPVRWTDPSGHTLYLSKQDALALVQALKEEAEPLIRVGSTVSAKVLLDQARLLGRLLKTIPALRPLLLLLGGLEFISGSKLLWLAEQIEKHIGEDGVAIATDESGVYFLNRSTGEGDFLKLQWYDRIGTTIFENLPASMRLGEKPVGDADWYKGYHFKDDERWAPANTH